MQKPETRQGGSSEFLEANLREGRLVFDWHRDVRFWFRCGFQGGSEAMLAQRSRSLIELFRREKAAPLGLKSYCFDRQVRAPNSLCGKKIVARPVKDAEDWRNFPEQI